MPCRRLLSQGVSRSCNRSRANQPHRACAPLVPFPEPSQRCYLDGSSLAQAPPCSEELPAFQMQGLGQKSWEDFLASHSRPDSVLCAHFHHSPAWKEGGRTSHPLNPRDDSSKCRVGHPALSTPRPTSRPSHSTMTGSPGPAPG